MRQVTFGEDFLARTCEIMSSLITMTNFVENEAKYRTNELWHSNSDAYVFAMQRVRVIDRSEIQNQS